MSDAIETLDTAETLAKFLKISVTKVRRETRQKNLPSIKVGKRAVRYNRAAVLAALETGAGK